MPTPRLAASAVVLAVAGAIFAAPAAAQTPRLLASWSFDTPGQVAADASGNGNDGRLGSSPGPDVHDPSAVAGRVGLALTFAGDSFVAIPDSTRLEPRALTVQAWVRRAGSPGAYRYVLSKGASGCERSAYGLYTALNGGMAFYVSDATTYTLSAAASPATIWDGAWHHVAGTFNGTHVRLFIDGVQVGNGMRAAGPIAYGAESPGVYIGSYRGSCTLPFAGDIDEVAVYDAATAGAGGPTRVAAALPGTRLPVREVQPRRCYSVTASRRSVVLRRDGRLVVTVRRAGRSVIGAKVRVSGAGVKKSTKLTRRGGRAVFTVRPRFRTKLRVQVVGQPSACATRKLTVRRP